MIYQFGEFELDTNLYELRAAGTRRPIEPQVFDVLTYLVRNRERIVPKTELLEKLWADRFVSEATLTSRLMAARKAVGDDAKRQSLIKTIHGRGYRFVASVSEATGAEADEALMVRPAAPPPASPPEEPSLEETFAQERLLVGRGREIERLGESLRLASAGKRQIVFVTGEGGAGKTTLVEAFLSSLRWPVRSRIARGQCLEHRGTGEPYLPLLEALERLCRGVWGEELIPLLRREAPSWCAQMPLIAGRDARDDGGEGASERMLREMVQALEAISAAAPLVLLFEDLHWSDYSTLDLITKLAHRTDPAQILVVGTFRPADVKAARHPLYGAVQELLIRGLCSEIALPLLDGGELESYVERKFPNAPFAGRLASILHQKTSGNPLFAGSLLDWWASQRLIVPDGDGWKLAGDGDALTASIPDTLRLLIEQHVSELPDERQRLLEAASVAGKDFAAAAIAAAVAAPEENVEMISAGLAREGKFIRATGSEAWPDGTVTERFAFTHDLYPDVLYGRLPAGQRARIHRLIGERLEAAWRGREGERAAELAHHFSRGRDGVRALRYERIAARLALRRSASHEAIEHLRLALEAIGMLRGTADTRSDEMKVRATLAEAIVATRGWGDAEAEENFLRARELAAELRDDEELSRILYGMATMYEFRGDYRRSEALVQERIALDVEQTPERLLQSHELLVCSLMHQARFDEALVHADLAIGALDQILRSGAPPPIIGIQSRGWASAALMFRGLADEALAESFEVRRLADLAENDLGKSIGYVQAACIYFYRREAAEASQCAEHGIEIGLESRFPFVVAVGRMIRGWCMAERGEPLQAALAEVRAGLRTCCMIGATMDTPLFLSVLADVAIRAGQMEEARDAIERALQTIEQARSFFYTPDVLRLRGVIAEEDGGDMKEAERWYRRALEMARKQRSPLLGLRAATHLCRISPAARGELASALADVVEGHDTRDVCEARELLERMG
jgi:DNA-binding winged helix-turn-helix (wHTH) protein/tetratricopeptide (TPR) repeat protein